MKGAVRIKRDGTVALVAFAAGASSGIPRYIVNLLRALDRDPPVDHPRPLVVTTPAGARELALQELPLAIVDRSAAWNHGSRRIMLDVAAPHLVPGCSLYHFFDYIGPLAHPQSPFTATLYDAQIRRHPENFSKVALAHKRIQAAFVSSRARRIIAATGFSKTEGVALLGTPEDRVHVVLPGPGLEPVRSAHEVEREDSTILYVGGFAATKNVQALIRAHACMERDAQMVLVGRGGAAFSDVQRLITASPRRRLIVLRRDADDAEVDRLYRCSTIFAFPSTYEGFGFPVIEAMARGCPTVASDLPVIRESVGAAFLPILPHDVAGIASALDRLLADASLRSDLVARGRNAAAAFSWSSTAQKVWTAVSEVAAS